MGRADVPEVRGDHPDDTGDYVGLKTEKPYHINKRTVFPAFGDASEKNRPVYYKSIF